MRLSYLLTLVVAATCYGQDASVGTPSIGLVFDETVQAIRAVRGIPGAALVEDPIDVGFSVRSAAISSQRRFALVTAEDSSVRLLRFQNGGVAAELIDSAMPAPDSMLLSPGGSAAVLYRAGRLQSISGLPERPIVRDWILPSVSARFLPLAVTDDAELVAAAADGEDPSTLWMLSSDGSASPAPIAGPAVAATFHRNRRDLIAVLANGDVCLLRNAGASGPCRTFPAATPDAAAVQFSPDGSRAYIAATDTLSVLDLQTGDTTRVSCGCRASSLDPTGVENVFRLTPAGATPVLLFDASKTEPRVWFVPRGGSRRAEGDAR